MSSDEANCKVSAATAEAVSGLHSHHSKHEKTESLTKRLSEPAEKQKPIHFIPEEQPKTAAAKTSSPSNPRRTRPPPPVSSRTRSPHLPIPAWNGRERPGRAGGGAHPAERSSPSPQAPRRRMGRGRRCPRRGGRGVPGAERAERSGAGGARRPRRSGCEGRARGGPAAGSGAGARPGAGPARGGAQPMGAERGAARGGGAARAEGRQRWGDARAPPPRVAESRRCWLRISVFFTFLVFFLIFFSPINRAFGGFFPHARRAPPQPRDPRPLSPPHRHRPLVISAAPSRCRCLQSPSVEKRSRPPPQIAAF